MKYVRIKSNFPDGTFTGCEHAYLGDNHTDALARFRKEYPEHNECIVIAQTIDADDPKWFGWIKAARDCGCVH